MNLFIKLDKKNINEDEVFKIRITHIEGWGTRIDMVDKTGNAFKSYQLKGSGYAEVEHGHYSE